MNIRKHIEILDNYEEKKQRAFIRLRLSHPDIIDYCKIFDKLKKKDIDSEMLDNVKDIIVHTKTIFDMDYYTNVFDDSLWDPLISKYKKFRPEPFGNESIGMANVAYKYETLAGTLDKAHFIFDAEREGKKDDRLSVEEFLSQDIIKKYGNLVFILNYKEDGVSLVVELELVGNKYIIDRSISRGKKDHGLGTDVSNITKGITFDTNIIKSEFGYCPEKLGVQMEMLVSDKDKVKLEEYLGQKFANKRSAVSALMRRLIYASNKEAKELRKLISLVPVGFEFKKKDKEFFSKYTWDKIYPVILKQFIYGSCEMSYIKIKGNKVKDILADIREYADDVINRRESLPNAIDGLVLTICNSDLANKLGRKNSINRWQVAFKFPEQVKRTKIIGLIETTGAFGYKEFLAQVEPVILNGTNQEKGQFHSLDKFKSFNARIGDEVYLKLSGDVIPYMYRDETCKKGDGDKLKLPSKCGCCGTKLVEEKNKLRCPNFNCDGRRVGRMITFFTELNSKGIGEAVCQNLYDIFGIYKPSDILQVTKEQFMMLPKFSDTSADNAVETLNEIMDTPRKLENIVSSVAIDMFRASTVKKVIDEIDFNELMDLAEDSNILEIILRLKSVKGIDKNAKIIAEGLIREVSEIRYLIDNMTIKKATKKSEDAKIILVSGIRNNPELEELSDEKGFIVKDSGKKYDILVIKDDTYRSKGKGKKASVEGKPIYTLDEFIKMMRDS